MFSDFFGGGGGGGFRFNDDEDMYGRKKKYEDIFANTDVELLNLSTVFKFYRRQEIWTILFYDVSKQESQDLKDEYKTLAEKMFGIIKVGAINCYDEEELCEEFAVYDTKEAPVIKIFTEDAYDEGEKFNKAKTW